MTGEEHEHGMNVAFPRVSAAALIVLYYYILDELIPWHKDICDYQGRTQGGA